ncbi:peptigoglycan-binding protein LysM [Pseudomonas cavernae]|uniref:Peptigoglycan-binding protein LysM n=1 Tax=Pseudomonas cavernae TaxID=2320867 RepID=A0A385Z498_9PSED|nr:FimV/HubP family polar landmark protein [Pseudomonas cavernae]AYC33531.1 peptigoglycan-binding protein LysM [Pseudomonas cavernae]
MVRVRKLVLAIAAASALTSGMAHALGLGEVTLKSALNQPLVAEIDLLEVRDLASNEVIPTLASPEEFNKAGVDRQYFLTDLKFTPVLKPNGRSVIRVTSSKPVREPYLNFLVEVLWPNGRLLREYTLLLDPPLYSPQTAAAAAPQLPVAAPTPRPSAVPAPSPITPVVSAPVVRPAAPAPVPASASKLDGNQYKTTGSDTLWEIAERSRVAGSVHQTMLAIQELNPDAFVGGNINRLKSGQVLRLPNEQQIKSRSQSEAIAQVAEQNTAWREGRSLAAGARQLDATKRTAAGAAPAKAETTDSLKLVSAEAGKAAAGSDKGAGADSKVLSDKLAVTKESLDSTRRENDELKGRMTDLQSQLDKLQRLIQLKDDQLAKLQADLAEKNKATKETAAAVAAAPVTAAEQTAAVTTAPAGAADAAPAPAPAAPQATAPAVDAAAAPDYNYSEEPAAKPEAAPQVDAQVPADQSATPAEPAAPAEKVATPIPAEKTSADAPVEQAQATGLLEDLLANPMLLGLVGGGALLALLVGLMVLSRRNALKESELHSSLAAQEGDDPFGAENDLPDSSFEGLESAEVAAAHPVEERVTAQTSDVLGEADIYIAYGRFNQAAELLQNAINDEPQRSDLRLKLMEVQAELGDREGFARQESELREIGGVSAEVDQLKSRYPAMAAIAAASMLGAVSAAPADEVDSFSLDDLALDDELEEQPQGQDDGFDLSLDDLEAEFDREASPAANEESLVDFDLESELNLSSPELAEGIGELEFDLSLDGDAPVAGGELTGDLVDFNLDLDEETKSAAAEDDFLLGLEDELSSGTTAEGVAELRLDLPEEVSAVDLELLADFDLSLDAETLPAPAADSNSFAAQLEEVSAELDQLNSEAEAVQSSVEFDELAGPLVATAPTADLGAEDDFDFLSGTDETATKLDLARAYIDMGDAEGARDILDEVIKEGNDGQQQEARELIARLA